MSIFNSSDSKIFFPFSNFNQVGGCQSLAFVWMRLSKKARYVRLYGGCDHNVIKAAAEGGRNLRFDLVWFQLCQLVFASVQIVFFPFFYYTFKTQLS
jgi:hypothetical protein